MRKGETILIILVLGVILSSTFASAGLLEWLGLKKSNEVVGAGLYEVGRFAVYNNLANSYKATGGVWMTDHVSSRPASVTPIQYCQEKFGNTATNVQGVSVTRVLKPFWSWLKNRESMG